MNITWAVPKAECDCEPSIATVNKKYSTILCNRIPGAELCSNKDHEQ